MNFAPKVTRFALVVAVLLVTAAAAGAQQSDVVAQIGGEKITRQQLAESESASLLQARYEFYQAENRALDGMINNRLLEAEAKRQNLTVEELLKKEVDSKIADLTDDQVRFVYEVMGSNEPFESMRVKIRDSVRQQKIKKARVAYMESVREKANVVVLLAPPRADFQIGDAPRLGPADAPVQLVEFADYECPYCIKEQPEIKKLKDEFGDKISFVYKDYPLNMHARAQKAAEAARCARSQNKFWEYHDQLFATKQIEVPQLKQLAASLGLDTAKFNACLDSDQQAAAVKKDAAEAQKTGLQATPSFFLNGHFFTGALPYEDLRKMVLRELAGKGNKTAMDAAKTVAAKAEE
jgi:protein-disulfide isomerase